MTETKRAGADPAEHINKGNYTMTEALQPEFSLFRNSFDTEPAGVTTPPAFIADIRGSKYQQQIEQHRAMPAEEKSQNKRNLPAVAFGGIFNRRAKRALAKASGLVVLDFDNLNPAELARTKAILSADRHTVLCFVSPSGAGLKAVFSADFSDDATFKQAYKAIANHLKAQYSLKLDESGKDICRLCYVSHDPEAYYNADAVQFCYELAAADEPAPRPAERPATPIFIGNYQQRYVLSVINGEIETVETAPQGNGNSSLNIAAMKIGQFYYLGLFDKEAIKQHLTAAYLRRGGSFKNQAEADATFESGWLAGVKSPRALPERGQS